tara:strand:+ start:2947 stop:4146 length:1200 start_codon:yes stop_codon:yes gene_type:complete
MSVLVGGLTARYLGAETLGLISFVYSLTAIVSPLGNLGVRDSLAVLLCNDSYPNNLTSTAFFIELVGSSLVAILIVPISFFSGGLLAAYFSVMAVLFNIFQSSEILETELINRKQGQRVAFVGVMQTTGGVMASLLALFLKAPSFVFAGLAAFQSFLRMLFLMASTRGIDHPLKRWPSLKTTKPLIAKGIPLMISNLLFVSYLRSDQVMLEWLRNSTEVGIYSVASKVSESLYVVPILIAQTFVPFLVSQGRETSLPASKGLKRNEYTSKLYQLSWFTGIALSLAIAFIFPYFVKIIFGSQFTESAKVLIWLAPVGFATSIGYASDSWLKVKGFQSSLIARGLFGAITNIALNFLLIPKFGVYGAAFSTSFSQLTSVVVTGLLSPTTRANTLRLLLPFC